jgi:putative transposase
MKQQTLNLFKGKWGGRRPGSGPKRIHSKGVAHRRREKVILKHPLHINFKVKASIRNKICLRILKRAVMNARRMGLSIRHFSLQSNHIHLIVEASDNSVLESGMRSLCVTFAKGLERGKVQKERYHLHVLKNLREVRNAVLYVVHNDKKHTGSTMVTEYSSLQFCEWILGWSLNSWMDQPRSWLLREAETLPIG